MRKIRNKKRIFNEKTILATVDIGKEYNYGYIRCYDGAEVAPFKFQNTYRGFTIFWHAIESIQRDKHVPDIIIGFESTGCYGMPLIHFLHDKPVTLVYVNPKHTKKVKEISDNSPNKHDKKDPKVIADIIELGNWLRVVVPCGTAADLRELVHARDGELKLLTELYNKLHAHVFRIFPEFQRVFTHLDTKTAHYLLTHYPTPEAIVSLGVEKLADIIHLKSRGRMPRDRAKHLYQYALMSVGIKEGQHCIADRIHRLLHIIEEHEQWVAIYEQRIAHVLSRVPESHLMLSIKGVGPITAAGLIGEIGNFHDFSSYAELEKFIGLNLYEVSSGKRRGQKRIAKRGRPLARKLLFFAAINVVRQGGIYHAHYQRYVARGMKKIKALTAISRKLLRLIYALVHHQCEFDLQYFQKQHASNAA